MLSFNESINNYLKNKNIDIYKHHLRIYYKDIGNSKIINYLYNEIPKKIPESLPKISSPFKLLNFSELTNAQNEIRNHLHYFEIFGSIAISTSCGSGKTLAGLYIMYHFKLKTLIISARTSINDQWLNIVLKLYPNLKIKTIEGWFINGIRRTPSWLKKNNIDTSSADIYIYTPQYLHKKLEKFPSDVDLIIFDEVHSMMAEGYSRVLTASMNLENREQLPYMIALSASFPNKSDKKNYTKIINLFGKPIKIKSTITDIPVEIWDRRNHYENLGEFDKNYFPWDDYEMINHFIKRDNEKLNIVANQIEITPKFKGFVITSRIDSSIYAWYYFAQQYSCGCILVRDYNQGYYYIPPNSDMNNFELNRLKNNEESLKNPPEFVIKSDNLEELLPEASVIFGTYHRLKEGISIENATWGICTNFLWSSSARIQIIGRIRRSSKEEEINKRRRIFIVNSHKLPNNEHAVRKTCQKYHQQFKKEKIVPLYDLNEEKIIFEMENYKYI